MKKLNLLVLSLSALALPTVAQAAAPGDSQGAWVIIEEIVKAVLAHFQG